MTRRARGDSARAVDSRQTLREGLAAIAAAAERLPGGIQQTRERVSDWRAFERFVSEGLESVARVWELLGKAGAAGDGLRQQATEATNGRNGFGSKLPKHQATKLPKHQIDGGLLARERESVVARFGDSREVVLSADAVRAAGYGWLERYRKHYLAWHGRVHAAARFGPLLESRRSAEMEAMRRLARAGLRTEEAAEIEAEVAAALGRRCLAGDPLPAGEVVCPICGVGFKEEVELPEAGEVGERVAGVLGRQLEGLRGQGEMLGRRVAGCPEPRVAAAVRRVIAEAQRDTSGQETRFPRLRSGQAWPTELLGVLSEEVVAWLREQLGQPRARRREVAALVERLRGKELAKQDVLRIVAEWLGEEDGFVEVV